ncbi:DUF6807 domain-containing protein [Roseimaritima ulvae]|uniref:Methane oxygenase PmoA n=1 Tax=Roseimaritima ulvae TaxID=980254 RepID=A0A5B9QKM2_9BACT|nr:PmoA family protein [Roseimaritima ulvae]QEG38292.1 hypothetical protein UC8_02480 [Roseimaritima ulvae]
MRSSWLIPLPFALASGLLVATTLTAQQPAPSSGPPQPSRVEPQQGALVVRTGEVEALRYHTATVPAPPELDAIYRRSGYIHPVRTPAGTIVTGDFSPDHAHQHALFGAWVKTEFDGHAVDFWNLHKGTGRVVHKRVVSTTNDDRGAQFVVEHIYQDLTQGDDPVSVLLETWTVHVHPRTGPYHVFDIAVQQRCVSDKPLRLLKYHYGGMALRGHNQWFKTDAIGCQFLTSEGHDRDDGNHTTARWVDMYGSVDGQTVGIAMLSHPSNLRAPQAVRLHPTMPYFCFAPMVQEGFEITPDNPYQARYRYLVHDGPPDVEDIDKHWQAYAKGK